MTLYWTAAIATTAPGSTTDGNTVTVIDFGNGSGPSGLVTWDDILDAVEEHDNASTIYGTDPERGTVHVVHPDGTDEWYMGDGVATLRVAWIVNRNGPDADVTIMSEDGTEELYYEGDIPDDDDLTDRVERHLRLDGWVVVDPWTPTDMGFVARAYDLNDTV